MLLLFSQKTKYTGNSHNNVAHRGWATLLYGSWANYQMHGKDKEE